MTAWLQHWFTLAAWLLLLASAVAVDPDDRKTERLIRQLSSHKFKEREEATKELNRIGKPCLRALRQAATDSIDPEVRSRATALIHAIEDSLVHCIDLRPHVNQKLNERFHDSFQGNDLAALPTGPQVFAGIKFMVAAGVVRRRDFV